MIDLNKELAAFIDSEDLHLDGISESIKLTSVNQIDLGELIYELGLTKNHANRINAGWRAWLKSAELKQNEINDLKAKLAKYENPLHYFSNDGENFEIHETLEKAKEEAQSGIDFYQDLLSGDGHDIYGDGNFNQISYGIVLADSGYTQVDTVSEKHHEGDEYKQFEIGAEILHVHLNEFVKTDSKLVLNSPARIGGTIFREGIAWETVINCAKRHYQQQQEHKDDKPIIHPSDALKLLSGDYVLIPKQCPDPDFADSLFSYLRQYSYEPDDSSENSIALMDIDAEKVWQLVVETKADVEG